MICLFNFRLQALTPSHLFQATTQVRFEVLHARVHKRERKHVGTLHPRTRPSNAIRRQNKKITSPVLVQGDCTFMDRPPCSFLSVVESDLICLSCPVPTNSSAELSERAAWDAVNTGSWDNATPYILPRPPSNISSALNAIVSVKKESPASTMSPTSSFLLHSISKRPRAPQHEEYESTDELSPSKKYSARKSKRKQLTFPPHSPSRKHLTFSLQQV